jgi:hypothetical protein
MQLPKVHGLIRRRLLVNFRVDAEVMSRFLPPPFRPKLHCGHAIRRHLSYPAGADSAGLAAAFLRDLTHQWRSEADMFTQQMPDHAAAAAQTRPVDSKLER